MQHARSFAYVNIDDAFARAARDETAPLKLALAPFDRLGPVRVVSPSAAHEVASVGTLGSPVAAPPPSAQRAGRFVLPAVVGRLVDKDEVILGRTGHDQASVSTQDVHEERPWLVEFDLDCTVVCRSEQVADVPEVR